MGYPDREQLMAEENACLRAIEDAHQARFRHEAGLSSSRGDSSECPPFEAALTNEGSERPRAYTFEEYAVQCKTTLGYPRDLHPLVPVYPTIALAGEVGELSEKVKKILRDRKSAVPLTDEERTDLLKEAGDVLWYLCAFAEDLGSSLEAVAKMNIAKLADRKARGTLSGSGDSR